MIHRLERWTEWEEIQHPYLVPFLFVVAVLAVGVALYVVATA
jgi:hypothetical protein